MDVSVSRAQWARIACDPYSAGEQERRKNGRMRAGFPRLEMLILREVPVTERDMEYIAKLTNLRILRLDAEDVTDTSLEHLFQSLGRLEKLYLSNPRLTDACLKSIASLSDLKELEVKSRQLTDAGMPYIARLEKLEQLTLFDTRVTDAGLVHLKHLKHLRRLMLTGTPITDTGLAQLRCLENLEYVDVYGANVSHAALWGLDSGKEPFTAYRQQRP